MRKGEIWLVDLPQGRGHEQRGKRPAVILGSAYHSVTVIPFTSNFKRALFDYTHVIQPTSENKLSADSIALVFKITSLDSSRFDRKLGTLNTPDIDAVEDLLRTYLRV